MALKSSHMGYVKISGIQIPNEQHTLDNGSRLDDITQSDSGGTDHPCTLYGFVREDNSYEVHVKRDDAAYFEVLGMSTGTIIPVIYLKLGAGTLANAVFNSTVEKVQTVVNPKDKFVEAVLTAKGGWVTPSVAIP